jgi:hypothetical protein
MVSRRGSAFEVAAARAETGKAGDNNNTGQDVRRRCGRMQLRGSLECRLGRGTLLH